MRQENLVDRILGLLVYAYVNRDHYYSSKAIQYAQAIGARPPLFIVVAKLNPNDLPQCGIACSIGFGSVGVIFVDRRILDANNIPNELKEFIIAHEVAHVVRGHVVASLLLKHLIGTTLEIASEAFETLEKARDIMEFFAGFIAALLFAGLALKLAVEVDPQTVKKQELEADELAIRLTGCQGAYAFIRILRELKQYGYSISHESLLGFPALTIEERIKFILQKCGSVVV